MKYLGLCILSVGFLYSSMALSIGYCDRFFDQGYEKGHRIGHDKGYKIGYDKGQKTYDCKKERHESYNKGYNKGTFEGSKNGYNKGYGEGRKTGRDIGYKTGYKTGYDTGYKKGGGGQTGGGGFCAFVFKFDGFIIRTDDKCSSSSVCEDSDVNTIDVCLVGTSKDNGPITD